MSVSMYNSSIPVIIRCLDSLSAILAKGANYAQDQGFDESVLTSARLFPNMHSLSKQVHICCDMVGRGGARLAQSDLPDDGEENSSFADLQARIASTQEFLRALNQAAINDSEANEIQVPAGPYQFEMSGYDYLNNWVLPNMYFHMTTTYNILRHNGVEIGKFDFLGGASLVG